MRNMSLMRVWTRAFIAAMLSAVLVVGAASAPASAVEPVPTQVVPMTLTGFDPGNLIDDAVFFATGTMSAAEIQAFLNSKVPACQSGYTCLKDFAMATTSRPADAMCRSTYTGRSRETAAEIIYNVAQACGINPQVFLVMLQKEQGLVTHSWPSPSRYTIAMGQGCPDTAACDTRYYGFFNQVYGAAWQLKRYANPPGTSQFFTWYAPGRTWNVRYNPNEACGSSPVFIANQATANLYYYTPYQPNAAALRAGYGTGDGCSAYGNRNFYNYFTDWFGSTRAAKITLAKTETSATVWVMSQGSRWALSSAAEWNELNRVFGPTYTVADSYLQSTVDRGVGGNIVRDASSGTMAVIDEGRAWGLTSCAAVATWGGSCANPVNLESSVFGKASSAPVVGSFLRVHGTAMWGRLESGTVRVLYDAASAQRLNGGTIPTAPRMTPRAYSALPHTGISFAPGELVYTPTNGTVYLTDAFDGLIALPSWATVREMGLPPASARSVDSTALSAYTRRGATLMPLVSCGTTTYLPAAGTLHSLANPAQTGLAVTPLSSPTCDLLVKSDRQLPAALVKSASGATVYVIVNGAKRPLTSWAAAVELGGASPVILTVDQGWLASLPDAAPTPPDGTLVMGSSASVYLLSGGQLLGLTSFSLSREIGFGVNVQRLTDAHLASIGSPSTAVSLWVKCATTTYFAAGGVLHPVQVVDPAVVPTALSAQACARLNLTGAAVPKVFIKGSGATIYMATGATFSPIGSWSRLLQEAGGTVPRILTISDGSLATLARGALLT